MMFFDRPSVSRKDKKRIMAVIILVLTLFFGLRWKCGTDWEQYYWIFREVTWKNFYNLSRYGDQNVEIGFTFVNVLLKTIGMGSYTFYLLATNLARFILIAYTSFKLSKYPIISFFSFMSLQYMFPTRNPYATAIFFVGFIFIAKYEFKNYILTWLGACSIHISSLLVFPMYFLRRIRLNLPLQITLYLSSILLATLLSGILEQYGALLSFGFGTVDEKIEVYTRSFRDIDATRGVVSMALPLFFICLFEYVRKKTVMQKQELQNYDFWVLCYIIATSLWNILSDSLPDLCRYVEFINTWPLLIPFVINKYRQKYFGLMVILLIAYFTYRLNNSINHSVYRDVFIPYRSTFD